MVKWLVRIAVLIAALGILSFLFRDRIFLSLMASQLKPAGTFEAATPPPAPDYGDDASWAALPGLADNADHTPDGTAPQADASRADVFFVQPTTYISKASWNAPFTDADANEFTDNFVLKGQASAFNHCCAVYAPRYRQATFWSFIDETGSGEAARAFAYADVERAFDAFLERSGDRPFIVAGHSQGGEHVRHLLERRVSGTPLKDRLIAAYPVGFYMQPSDMSETAPDIPLCDTPDATGCYVTWNAMGPKARIFADAQGAACVNPLSWRTDGAAVPADANPGSLATSEDRFEAGVSGAQCISDRLLVGPFQSDIFDQIPFNMGKDNHHLLDYALFYASIRENAARRTSAFLADPE